MIDIEKFKLETVMQDVLEGVIWKDSVWMYWYNDTDFDNGDEPKVIQECYETFSEFIIRCLQFCVEREKNDEYPDTAINFAIHCNGFMWETEKDIIKKHIPNFHQWHEDCQKQVEEMVKDLISKNEG